MLEALSRDGRARVLQWSPSEGQDVRTPELIVPRTSQTPVPAWAAITLTDAPTGDGIELLSTGTWFFPSKANGPLVVAAPQPTGTHQVQVLAVGEELAVFHDAGGWASNPERLVPAFIEAKTQATPGRLFWAPARGS